MFFIFVFGQQCGKVQLNRSIISTVTINILDSYILFFVAQLG